MFSSPQRRGARVEDVKASAFSPQLKWPPTVRLGIRYSLMHCASACCSPLIFGAKVLLNDRDRRDEASTRPIQPQILDTLTSHGRRSLRRVWKLYVCVHPSNVSNSPSNFHPIIILHRHTKQPAHELPIFCDSMLTSRTTAVRPKLPRKNLNMAWMQATTPTMNTRGRHQRPLAKS